MSGCLQTMCLLAATLFGQDLSSYQPPDPVRHGGDIAFEVRFISISDDTFAKAFPDRPRKGPMPCTRVRTIRCIDNHEVASLLEAMQSNLRTNTLSAPRLTMDWGQQATVKAGSTETYVTKVEEIECKGQTCYLPATETFDTGIEVSLKPTLSAAAGEVRVRLGAKITSRESGPVPLEMIQKWWLGGDGALPQFILLNQFIQKPVFRTLAVKKTLTIPDGKTAVFTGWKGWCTVESKAPVLGEIPVLERFFRSQYREIEHVVLMITPRVVK